MEVVQVEYERLQDKSVIVHNIPILGEEETTVSVQLRPVTRRDRLTLKGINEDDPDAAERMLSVVVKKWGDRDGISSIELAHEKYDEAVMILMQAVQEFFQKDYQFCKRK
jgi:hypothetical protein